MSSAKQKAAAAKASAASHAKHGKGNLTPDQLTADRANLAKARANVVHNRSKAVTAAQSAALAKGRAAARAAHPAGSQTPKQLAAERANLAKARAAETAKRTASHTASRTARSKSFRSTYSVGRMGRRPLGTHRISSAYRHRLTVLKPTGVNHKLKRRIAPTSFDQRGSWKTARTHHLSKRLHLRRKRRMHLKDWRGGIKRLTPK